MTRPLAKSIINSLLKRVIVRTTTIKYAQFDARPKFNVVVTVVCVCERFGWMDVQPKAGKDEKCFCGKFEERSRKGEAAIKSRIVGVNCENNFKKVNAYWLQSG